MRQDKGWLCMRRWTNNMICRRRLHTAGHHGVTYDAEIKSSHAHRPRLRVRADSVHGDARIHAHETARLHDELIMQRLVLITAIRVLLETCSTFPTHALLIIVTVICAHEQSISWTVHILAPKLEQVVYHLRPANKPIYRWLPTNVMCFVHQHRHMTLVLVGVSSAN